MTSLDDLAARLGRLRFVELRLFEVLGAWVASTPEPQVKAFFAEQCYHHAWHGELWGDRFPQGYGHDLVAATAEGGAPLGGWLDQLAALEGTVERLAGLYRVVVPRLALAYRRWRSEADRVADGPLLRWLAMVSSDETADWQQGERLLQQLLVGPESVERAAAAQVRIETSVVASFAAHGDLLHRHPSAERRSAGDAPSGGSS
jgi:hypothetical protein